MSRLSRHRSADSDRKRQPRADAQRSVAAILDAAARVFAENPGASMEDVARTAGLTRQTVYAHFPARDALLAALTDRSTSRVLSALEAADLDKLTPSDALVRLVQIGWQEIESATYLLADQSAATPEDDLERHQPILVHLHRIIERGHQGGDFDPDLPASWIAAATIALGHATGEQVRIGTLSLSQASTTLTRALPRLFSA